MIPIDPTLLESLGRLAESAARAGGAVVREAFGRRVAVSLKSDASEVSEIDIAAEIAVFAYLQKERPDDAFIGEESNSSAAGGGRVPQVAWIVDPIDGTRNFIRGVPLFATSVAAMIDGTPVAGAIYEPMGDRLYAARAGAGATCNGKTIRLKSSPNSEATVRNPTLVVAIPSAWRAHSSRQVEWLLKNTIVRSLGCATLHLVHVATGGIDATLMNNCKLWDIAAGWRIATEAGATVTRPDGGPLFPTSVHHQAAIDMPLLAGAPAAHAELRRAFERDGF